jgi:hypothetical protein
MVEFSHQFVVELTSQPGIALLEIASHDSKCHTESLGDLRLAQSLLEIQLENCSLPR